MSEPVNTSDCRWAIERRGDLTRCKPPGATDEWAECTPACPFYESPPPSVTAAQVAAGVTESVAYDGYASYAHHEYAGQWEEDDGREAEPTKGG